MVAWRAYKGQGSFVMNSLGQCSRFASRLPTRQPCHDQNPSTSTFTSTSYNSIAMAHIAKLGALTDELIAVITSFTPTVRYPLSFYILSACLTSTTLVQSHPIQHPQGICSPSPPLTPPPSNKSIRNRQPTHRSP